MLCTSGVFFLTSSRYFPSISGLLSFREHKKSGHTASVCPRIDHFCLLPYVGIIQIRFTGRHRISALSACSGKLPFRFIMLPGQNIVNRLRFAVAGGLRPAIAGRLRYV